MGPSWWLSATPSLSQLDVVYGPEGVEGASAHVPGSSGLASWSESLLRRPRRRTIGSQCNAASAGSCSSCHRCCCSTRPSIASHSSVSGFSGSQTPAASRKRRVDRYPVHAPLEDGDAAREPRARSGLQAQWHVLLERHLPSKEVTDEFLWEHRTQVTAGTASLVSTMASFPFDSVKSRLQVKDYPSPAIWNCTKAVAREEGLGGFFRGVWIPLITITFVRTSSFSIYYGTKERLHEHGYFTDKKSLWDTALSGAAGGATSGVIISCGSAPFELVKVQRQLEYLIAVQNGLVKSPASAPGKPGRPAAVMEKFKPQSGFQAASAIWKNHGGVKGFYIGFPMHIMRDTVGTTLYFGFYDTMRSLVQRNSTGDSTSGPQLWGIPGPVVSFLTGSTAGIASWLIVYPIDLLKTNVQKRELSGHPRKLTGMQLFARILAERPPPEGQVSRDTLASRFLRLYRGLGVSALRSFISHGMTWSLIETISARISERVGKKVSYVPGDNKED